MSIDVMYIWNQYLKDSQAYPKIEGILIKSEMSDEGNVPADGEEDGNDEMINSGKIVLNWIIF